MYRIQIVTSLAAKSCCTTAELTVFGIVKIFSRITFNRSRTPYKKAHKINFPRYSLFLAK